MRIVFYGDSLTQGIPGVSFIRILEGALAEHTFINRGKGGDTVPSLFRRLVGDPSLETADLAFLWVGVNDVFSNVTTAHALFKRIRRQTPANDLAEFRDTYDRTLRLLSQETPRVIAVSPLLIGEDLSNEWNRELVLLCAVIESVSLRYDNAEYCDLRARFTQELSGKVVADYVPKRLPVVARDALLLRSPSQVDAVASSRGLHFTLDGVHLNSAGAALVAASFRDRIENATAQPRTTPR